jgi:hypothetical protein
VRELAPAFLPEALSDLLLLVPTTKTAPFGINQLRIAFFDIHAK